MRRGVVRWGRQALGHRLVNSKLVTLKPLPGEYKGLFLTMLENFRDQHSPAPREGGPPPVGVSPKVPDC